MKSRIAIVAFTAVLATIVFSAHAAEPQPFIQDRFAIGFWVDPPLGKDMDARYKELADANFTMVLGGFGAATPADVLKQLALCRKYDLRAVVAANVDKPDTMPKDPICWGYSLRDEPGAKDFPALRAMVDKVRAARPGKLAYINLFPNYANAEQLGTPTYDEHVARFVREVGVDVLSMDHYPVMRPDMDTRENYCANLLVMRKYALERNIPFWNFFNIMPFGPHFDPTEAQVRWQIYTSIAYGAKGVLYFCYWTPAGDEFPKGGAIITHEGARTRHYEQAKRINAAIKNLGPTLMKLTSVATYRCKPTDTPATALAGSPITSITAGDYLVGTFTHPDGRRAVLLNNYSDAYTAWPTIEFDTASSRITEVDQTTGEERFIRDDSPALPGLQLSIDSGEGRLFLLPAK